MMVGGGCVMGAAGGALAFGGFAMLIRVVEVEDVNSGGLVVVGFGFESQ